MDDLQKLLKETTENLERFINEKDKQINEKMPEVKKACTPAQFEFIENSLKSAKKGELNLSTFIEQVKIFNHGS